MSILLLFLLFAKLEDLKSISRTSKRILLPPNLLLDTLIHLDLFRRFHSSCSPLRYRGDPDDRLGLASLALQTNTRKRYRSLWSWPNTRARIISTRWRTSFAWAPRPAPVCWPTRTCTTRTSWTSPMSLLAWFRHTSVRTPIWAPWAAPCSTTTSPSTCSGTMASRISRYSIRKHSR